jgi:hypothetical protein
MNLSMRVVVALAVAFGLTVAIAVALVQNSDFGDTSAIAAEELAKDEDPLKGLSVEALKAMPPEQFAEMFPEKAEAILNPESARQISSAGSKSDDPEYLRAVIQKLGGDPPADASTKELQDMLEHISVQSDQTGQGGK